MLYNICSTLVVSQSFIIPDLNREHERDPRPFNTVSGHMIDTKRVWLFVLVNVRRSVTCMKLLEYTNYLFSPPKRRGWGVSIVPSPHASPGEKQSGEQSHRLVPQKW